MKHSITCVTNETEVTKESMTGNDPIEPSIDFESDSEYPDELQLAPELEPTADDIESGYCVLDSSLSCGEGGLTGGNIPCVRAKRPQRLNNTEALLLLKETCPEFLEQEENPLLCCDFEALKLLADSYIIPKNLGLGRCPSCLFNWRKTFCNSACSPKQNKFLTVSKSTLLEENGLKRVDEVIYYMNKEFAINLYDSCKYLEGIAPGTYIMDLMCGKWGSSQCNGFRWLEYMGLSSENGGHAPFQINYVFTNENSLIVDENMIYPLNVNAISCSETPPGEESCTCRDCEPLCKIENPPNLPLKSEPTVILNMSGTTAAALILYIIIATSVFLYFTIFKMRNKTSYSGNYRLFLNISLIYRITYSIIFKNKASKWRTTSEKIYLFSLKEVLKEVSKTIRRSITRIY